jgi:hypothetical protein
MFRLPIKSGSPGAFSKGASQRRCRSHTSRTAPKYRSSGSSDTAGPCRRIANRRLVRNRKDPTIKNYRYVSTQKSLEPLVRNGRARLLPSRNRIFSKRSAVRRPVLEMPFPELLLELRFGSAQRFQLPLRIRATMAEISNRHGIAFTP